MFVQPPEILDQPVFGPGTQRDLRRLWKALRAIVDVEDIWQATPSGDGPYRQNTYDDPRPIVRDGRRFPRTFTFKSFAAHATSRRVLLLVSRDGGAVTLHRLDVDDKRASSADRAVAYAHRVNREVLGGRGFVCPSRSTGASLYLLVDASHLRVAERAAWLRGIGESIVARCTQGFGDSPVVEAFAGVREATVDNPLYDPAYAAERVRTRPWPTDGRRVPPELSYLYRADNDHAYVDTRANHYDVYAHRYGDEGFHRCERLECRTAPRVGHHATVLAPCCHRPDEPSSVARGRLRACADWFERSAPLTVGDLTELLTGGQSRAVVPARSTSQQAWGERMAEIRRLAALDDADEFGTGRGTAGGTSGVFTPRIAEMVRSGDKVQQANGIVFAVLRATGGRYAEELAERLYDEHVGEGRPCDAKRRARLRNAGRRAEVRFLNFRDGASAVVAFDVQRYLAVRRAKLEATNGLGAPTWFTEADIKIVIEQLKGRGVRPADLGTSTYRGTAVVFLTARKNQALWQSGAIPEVVRARQQAQAATLEATGFGGRQIHAGTPIPTAGFRGMLRSLRCRTSGRAVADAIRLLMHLGAMTCTSRSYNSGAFEDDGSKVGEGYCRRYAVGAVELPLALGEAVAPAHSVLYSQTVWGPGATCRPPETVAGPWTNGGDPWPLGRPEPPSGHLKLELVPNG
ncbi:MAG TPA: hypothetical protein VGN72_09515 [Tepidisphaeraceae bacterium]|nr:hypothetical protein [Tepidisphaeraceae bacterium]